ncbi:MOSC domain-containing protein [Streptomyces gamaensis]|uniref:MOSC domain-containing protein n=1 Tax=Streptomyces gamaensis TaxID=1763542 RepID=A0ABW0Z456_9ACTN
MAAVLELTTYPIKGCAGTPLTETLLTEAGLAHDRTFMVVDEGGGFRSQRTDPRLAVVRPEVDADGTRLLLRAPGVDELRLDVDLLAARREVELFGRPYRGIDQGAEAAAWFSEVLGAASRLVRVPPEQERVTDGWIPGRCGYADSGATLVVCPASLAEFNRRVTERGGVALPMDRFRPNIVVGGEGWDEPHTEDRARRFTVGNAELGYAKLATRCVVTTVDQDQGVKSGPEPLRTLATYRRRAKGGVAFGAKFSVVRAGKLAVGDAVTVSEWGESELRRVA